MTFGHDASRGRWNHGEPLNAGAAVARSRDGGLEGLAMLRFSIRDVFWLILVVAVGMGWYVSEQSWLIREHKLEVKSAQRESPAWTP